VTRYVVIWLLVAAGIVFYRWRVGRGMGLVVAFVLSLTSLHWLAATLYVMPWYSGVDADDVATGLRISLIGLLGFGMGVILMSRWLRGRDAGGGPDSTAMPVVNPRIGLLYVGVGVALYGAMLTSLRSIPSIGGLASAGSTAAVFGLCLLVWHARPSRRLFWLAGAGLLPLITILTQGYLSYGIAALVMVVAFVAEWHRPRWALVVMGLVLSYVAMSFYVTYMRDRKEIREAVWNKAAASDRLAVVKRTLTSIEPFDPFDDAHLGRVDDRLNQNYLVGRAALWIGNGFATYGEGSTLVDAAAALVPRILWPGKHVSAGSGDLVTQFTGIQFAEDTSVGIGQVMEFYVNFGTFGVLLGFAVVGAVVVFFDERAGWHLRQGDVQRACLWYLPALSLLQVGGSFVDVGATMAGAFGCAVLATTAHGVLVRAGAIAPESTPGAVTHEPAVL